MTVTAYGPAAASPTATVPVMAPRAGVDLQPRRQTLGRVDQGAAAAVAGAERQRNRIAFVVGLVGRRA